MSADATTARVRWSRVLPAVAFALVAIAVCGTLGWWQWTRAHDQAVTVQQEPEVALVEVIEPAMPAGAAIGRQVTVQGRWLDADAAVVRGREVDGVLAAFLVRPFVVDASQTGTGEEATLAVLVGWAPEDDVVVAPPPVSPATVAGYLRASEASQPGTDGTAVDNAVVTGSVSVATFAQEWPAPMYSAVLASDAGEPGWDPLPAREPPTRLDFRSLAYAIEWWIFGAFAVFLAGRWIRDNGFTRPATASEDPADD